MRCQLTDLLCEGMSGINNDLPPTPAPTGNSGFTLLLILAKEKLIGPNYLDWMCALRLTLRYETRNTYSMNKSLKSIRTLPLPKKLLLTTSIAPTLPRHLASWCPPCPLNFKDVR
ncbi:hypothetical protein L6452_14786 [Arctium lappa]|uniref:Uncharacterized protein n=1 Tax=Arctium lappa TaxID=4217 RepID=A0ACB9CLZ3_ARCLA|nr:hypothetical protein L6452_14786 [Arctium lappa]